MEFLTQEQRDIIKAVVGAMLPLQAAPQATKVVETAIQNIVLAVIPREQAIERTVYPAGISFLEPEISHQEAATRIQKALDESGYRPADSERGTLTDLASNERCALLVETATKFVFSFRAWKQGQTASILALWPAQEFVRVEERMEPRNWSEHWAGAGGQFFPHYGSGSDYPEGRMIALKSSPIWETISAFGNPWAPFDFNSGMDTRDVEAAEAEDLGLIDNREPINPSITNADFVIQIATGVSKRLEQLEAVKLRRKTDPVTYSTGNELLELAEEMAEEIPEGEKPTEQGAKKIKTLIAAALKKGFGCGSRLPDELNRRLADVYDAIGEQEPATLYDRKAIETEFASALRRGNGYDLVQMAERLASKTNGITPESSGQIVRLAERAIESGVGKKYNLRAKAHRILSRTYERLHKPRKAGVNFMLYVKWADGFLLLQDAQEQLSFLGNNIDRPHGTRILNMLTRAAKLIPADASKHHAQIYRATAEILEAWSDMQQAVQYYEYALEKDAKIGVRKRLKLLRTSLGKL